MKLFVFQQQLTALGSLQGVEESADWIPVSELCRNLGLHK